MKKFNHIKDLKYFTSFIQDIEKENFKVIGVSQLYFYDIFIFETTDDAFKAEKSLIKPFDDRLFFGKENFLGEVEKYENEYLEYKVLIHWLI